MANFPKKRVRLGKTIHTYSIVLPGRSFAASFRNPMQTGAIKDSSNQWPKKA
jgi:hypothetical protein